ncbi:hypothetical protein E2C01_016861 [Portunus trituberculatus]|uniref:Uncharacterized protein n=1 Tax=Portunus trituberculatus TaxID=210409 RepID=A0A5B7DSA4_PORTR|nr:hypothetical protein [Portunus trituberculatus]
MSKWLSYLLEVVAESEQAEVTGADQDGMKCRQRISAESGATESSNVPGKTTLPATHHQIFASS